MEYIFNKFKWPKDGYFDEYIVKTLEEHREKALEYINIHGEKACDFLATNARKKIKEYYEVENRPKYKNKELIREFDIEIAKCFEYKIYLDDENSMGVIFALPKSNLDTKNFVVGIHGTNENREYYLNCISDEPRAGHEDSYGFLVLLLEKGVGVVTVDLPGMGMDYPTNDYNSKRFANNIVYSELLGRLIGQSYIKEAVNRIMGLIDLIKSGEVVNAESIGIVGFSLGGTCASVLGACDDRINLIADCAGTTTYEAILKFRKEYMLKSTYCYGDAFLSAFGDTWLIPAAIYPRAQIRIACKDDQYIEYEGVLQINELLTSMYSTINLEKKHIFSPYEGEHIINSMMKKKLTKFFVENFNNYTL